MEVLFNMKWSGKAPLLMWTYMQRSAGKTLLLVGYIFAEKLSPSELSMNAQVWLSKSCVIVVSLVISYHSQNASASTGLLNMLKNLDH